VVASRAGRNTACVGLFVLQVSPGSGLYGCDHRTGTWFGLGSGSWDTNASAVNSSMSASGASCQGMPATLLQGIASARLSYSCMEEPAFRFVGSFVLAVHADGSVQGQLQLHAIERKHSSCDGSLPAETCGVFIALDQPDVIVGSRVLGSEAKLQFNGVSSHISLAAGLDSLVLDRRSGLVTAHWSIWAPPVDDRPWTQGEWASSCERHAIYNSQPEVYYSLQAATPAPGERWLLPLQLGACWWHHGGGGGGGERQHTRCIEPMHGVYIVHPPGQPGCQYAAAGLTRTSLYNWGSTRWLTMRANSHVGAPAYSSKGFMTVDDGSVGLGCEASVVITVPVSGLSAPCIMLRVHFLL